MVRNLGVKETRCPPCRSDFSEVQLCATPRQRGAIIIQLVGVQGYVKLRCKISSQSLSLSLFPFFIEKILLSPCSRVLIFIPGNGASRNGSKNTSPHQIHAPQRGNAPFGGAQPKFRVSFSRVSWKIPLNVYPRLRIVPRWF